LKKATEKHSPGAQRLWERTNTFCSNLKIRF